MRTRPHYADHHKTASHNIMIEQSQPYALLAPSIFDGVILHSDSALLMENGTIVDLTPQSKVPDHYPQYALEGTLLPGFIDLQVNGGGGILFNDQPTILGLQKILNAHQSLGTAALLPTLITADDQTLLAGLQAVEEGIKQDMEGLLGIHIEGPMINPKRKGIHKLENIRTLNEAIIEEICQKKAFTRLITLAPEMVPLQLIERLSNAGVIIFAGHTEASPSRLNEAVAAGVKGFTHLYNAMPQMASRNPQTTGYAIQSKETYASIIHDTYHVDPLMVKLAYQSKPQGTLFLVSDAMSSIGSDQTSFTLDDQTIYVKEGRLTNIEGTLSGAHIDMATSALNSAELLDISLEEALAMGTSIPAKIIQSNQYGYFKKGYKAVINQLKSGKIMPVSLKNLS